jgi:hypothetical protein
VPAFGHALQIQVDNLEGRWLSEWPRSPACLGRLLRPRSAAPRNDGLRLERGWLEGGRCARMWFEMERLVSEKMDVQTVATEAEARLPWHRPTVQRLAVSLDTRDQTGSVVDACGSTPASGTGLGVC